MKCNNSAHMLDTFDTSPLTARENYQGDDDGGSGLYFTYNHPTSEVVTSLELAPTTRVGFLSDHPTLNLVVITESSSIAKNKGEFVSFFPLSLSCFSLSLYMCVYFTLIALLCCIGYFAFLFFLSLSLV